MCKPFLISVAPMSFVLLHHTLKVLSWVGLVRDIRPHPISVGF